MPACAFDQIVTGARDALVVLEEPDLVAFLDNRPVFPGHTLVVPRRHYETLSDLPAGVGARLWEAAHRVAGAQRSALGAEGTFFGLNDVVSQSVPHVHLHVVPRRRGDGLRGFFWPRRRYAGAEEAAAVAASIRSALAAHDVPHGAGSDRVVAPGRRARPRATTLRDARRGDAGRLAEILEAGSLTASEDTADVAAYRDALTEIVSGGTGGVLVAEQDGLVVGMCQLIVFRHVQERGGTCAEIESLHVHPEFRGHGIGSLLIDEVVERARLAGCYRIQLTSNKARTDAHRFYLRHGFAASHEGFKLYLQPAQRTASTC